MKITEEVLMYHTSNRVIFRNRDVGYMDYGDDGSLNVFVSERQPRHVMQKYQSFGASKAVLDFVMAAPFGATKIRFVYSGKNLTHPKVYEYDIDTFLSSPYKRIDMTTDGTPDLQFFVPLEEQDYMEIKDGLPDLSKKYMVKENASNAV